MLLSSVTILFLDSDRVIALFTFGAGELRLITIIRSVERFFKLLRGGSEGELGRPAARKRIIKKKKRCNEKCQSIKTAYR